MPSNKTTALLLILDGWGDRLNTDHNAIANAHTPNWDVLINQKPHTQIATSGIDVGLPEGQMGNSEVGHMSLGSGRVVYQNISRINKAITEEGLEANPVYKSAFGQVKDNSKALHLISLLSPGGVHSHQDHLFAMIEAAHSAGVKNIFVHAILDGRDTPPRSASPYLAKLKQVCDSTGAKIASIIGRFYAMDRDKRWDRVEAAYNLIAHNQAAFDFDSAEAALQAAYDRDENDEFVKPTLINTKPIEQGDAVIFMNFRADRARELTEAFISDDFNHFDRGEKLQLSDFVMTTEYADDLKTSCAFPPQSLENSLGEHLANLGKSQLRIAETEKYAHVTFFFSGGREATYPHEERVLIPSPDVATYDLKPEMSVYEVTEKLVEAIKSGKYDSIICNIANGDMVGHTGNYDAAVKAVEAVDECLGLITQAIEDTSGHCLITADHGNCEQMIDYENNQPHTQHTTGPVPLVYIGAKTVKLKAGGRLADVAPTLLDLLELPQPEEMTGISLIN